MVRDAPAPASGQSLLLTRCSAAKRRRRREDESLSSSSSLDDNFTPSLDNTTDDILNEILLRLPSAKSAVGSKLVSKRWCSLISSASFVSNFISRHINHSNATDNDDNYYAAAYQIPPSIFFDNRKKEIFTITGKKNLIFKSPFEYLPVQEREVFCGVAAFCNDLVLIVATNHVDDVTSYFICNPFTMQWLLLPPAPQREVQNVCFGLVCESNYQRPWVQGQEHQCRFRVVVIHEEMPRERFIVHTYCSETRQWNESLLLGSQYNSRLGSTTVAYDGKLHWYNGTDIVAYDPFYNGGTTFIDGSALKLPRTDPFELPDTSFPIYMYHSRCFGVCQGSLRFMRLACNAIRPDTDHLSIWEVKDYETKRLSLVCEIPFTTMKGSLVQKFSDHGQLLARALAFHPNNKDVVYLGLLDEIISCNIQSRELEVVGTIQIEDYCYDFRNIFSIVLPWWPTPVSTIASSEFQAMVM